MRAIAGMVLVAAGACGAERGATDGSVYSDGSIYSDGSLSAMDLANPPACPATEPGVGTCNNYGLHCQYGVDYCDCTGLGGPQGSWFCNPNACADTSSTCSTPGQSCSGPEWGCACVSPENVWACGNCGFPANYHPGAVCFCNTLGLYPPMAQCPDGHMDYCTCTDHHWPLDCCKPVDGGTD